MYYIAVDGGRAPSTAHETLEEAYREAERLLHKENKRVAVYRIVTAIVPQTVKGGDDGLV